MSNLTINNKTELKGIVYFKGLPYNNSNVDNVKGAVRLKKLRNTISVNLEDGVLDLRDISKADIDTYSNANHYISKGGAYAIYFTNNSYSKTENDYRKIVDFTAGNVVRFVYYNNEWMRGLYNATNTSDTPTSNTPRTLKDFEYYGNNGNYKDGSPVALNNKNIDFIRAEGLIPRRSASAFVV